MIITREERPSGSPYVETIWHYQSEQPGSFISTAAVHWEMVVTRCEGKMMLTVRGPETKATPAEVAPDAEWLGITFKLGTFMPDFPPGVLLDRNDVNLPEATGNSFWLYGSTWEVPTYENVDTFVARLEREGLLKHDPLVDAVRQGQPQDVSLRTLQYRFVRATGLPHKVIQQIERARRATTLLKQGTPILDIAFELGYFDQSHLTNALKRFLGQTPAQIADVKQPE